MDEPTEGLDPNQRVPIRELIRKMGEERTVMLSTHVLPEVEEVCDRLIIIRRGNIVAQGTPDELRNQALSQSYIVFEVEGEGVEKALDEMDLVESYEVRSPGTNGRKTVHDLGRRRHRHSSLNCSSWPRTTTGCCGSSTMRRRASASCSAPSRTKAWGLPVAEDGDEAESTTTSNEI